MKTETSDPGFFTWDKLPEGAERITWEFKPDAWRTDAQNDFCRRSDTHYMVLYSMYAHAARLICTGAGFHKTCVSSLCRRHGHCMTKRPGEPPEGGEHEWLCHKIMPLCVPEEGFDNMRYAIRDYFRNLAAILQEQQET